MSKSPSRVQIAENCFVMCKHDKGNEVFLYSSNDEILRMLDFVKIRSKKIKELVVIGNGNIYNETLHFLYESGAFKIRHYHQENGNWLLWDDKNGSIKIKRTLVTLERQDIPIFIGSSTGGTQAVFDILAHFRGELPPIVVIQHIPELFSKQFADRINSELKYEAFEVRSGQKLSKNCIYIAPGGKQIKLVKSDHGHSFVIRESLKKDRHRPSIDHFFNSVCDSYSDLNIGMILTGMGKDGSEGLLRMKKNGSITIAQSEESCTVFGMPKAAINIGAVDYIVDLQNIPLKISEIFSNVERLKVGA